jgi:AcrR family transcriptional regulator
VSTAGPAGVDGRTARRDRNRDAVLDAVIEMFHEGRLRPSAADVAERSGVSLRSVFRYFDDTDALVQVAMARHLERIAPLYEMPDLGIGPFDERAKRFVITRLDLYDAAAPTARVAIARITENDTFAERLRAVRRLLRAQAEAMFAPELDAMEPPSRDAALHTIDTLFQFEAFEHMTVHRGLDREQVADTLQRALSSLLH